MPAAVAAAGPAVFRAEFVPKAVGEHRLNVLVDSVPIPASPFHLKVSFWNIILFRYHEIGTLSPGILNAADIKGVIA